MRTDRTDSWVARPVLGAALRLLVLLGPVAAGIASAVLLSRALPAATTAPSRIAWWAAVLGGSALVVFGADRLARRLLPLAVLFELSLVFPDKAPSRLRAARTPSVRQLEDRLAGLRRSGEPLPPQAAAETLVTLVGILGLHDRRTRGHSERVRAFTDLLTLELDLPEGDRVRLRWAALVHDLGKLSVTRGVLNGGRDLSEQDWQVLRRHPEEGVRLVSGLLPWLGEWGAAVGQHHERWDGGGYPVGLAGEQISYAARIVAVADSFETMTSARSYKASLGAAEGRRELMRCAGSQFDPAVVRVFLNISLGRLRWVLGPVTWLAQLPFVAAADRSGQLVKTAAVGAGVLGMIGLGSLPGPGGSPVPPPSVQAAPSAPRTVEPQTARGPETEPRAVARPEPEPGVAAGAGAAPGAAASVAPAPAPAAPAPAPASASIDAAAPRSSPLTRPQPARSSPLAGAADRREASSTTPPATASAQPVAVAAPVPVPVPPVVRPLPTQPETGPASTPAPEPPPAATTVTYFLGEGVLRRLPGRGLGPVPVEPGGTIGFDRTLDGPFALSADPRLRLLLDFRARTGRARVDVRLADCADDGGQTCTTLATGSVRPDPRDHGNGADLAPDDGGGPAGGGDNGPEDGGPEFRAYDVPLSSAAPPPQVVAAGRVLRLEISLREPDDKATLLVSRAAPAPTTSRLVLTGLFVAGPARADDVGTAGPLPLALLLLTAGFAAAPVRARWRPSRAVVTS